MARRSPGIRRPSVRTGNPGSAIVGRTKAGGIRSRPPRNTQRVIERARKAQGNVKPQTRSIIGGKAVTSSKSADAMNMQVRKPASSIAALPSQKMGLGQLSGIATASRQLGGRGSRQMGGPPTASPVASLARPLKRKPTRGMSRGSSRR
jgi:hypothetical protein